MEALDLQDLKMTDDKKSIVGYCRKVKMIDQIVRLENAGPCK